MIRKTIVLLSVVSSSLSLVFAQVHGKHSNPICNFERGQSMSIDHDDDVELKFAVNWGSTKPFFMGGMFTCYNPDNKS